MRTPPVRVGEATVRRKLHRGPDRQILLPTLRVVAGRDMLRYVTLTDDDELVIGRDEDAGLVLTDASVSRRHASVRSSDNGVITVQDLGSTNGTAINGLVVTEATLRPGDHVEVGAVSLRLDLLSVPELTHLQTVLERLEAKDRDPLTRLLTRAWIGDELPAFVDASESERKPYSCLFADVDLFKSINDRFGHQVGDEVLVGVSRLMILGVRATDVCVRYGGEELVVFLLDTTEEAAAEVAERVRRLIESHDWSRTKSGLQVTVSIGVAVKKAGEPIKEWINRADRALYAAKARGRNRVVRSSDLD